MAKPAMSLGSVALKNFQNAMLIDRGRLLFSAMIAMLVGSQPHGVFVCRATCVLYRDVGPTSPDSDHRPNTIIIK